MNPRLPCLIMLLLFVASTSSAQDATQAGRFCVEHPTLLNLGFEWSITGDANRNAAVTVAFRQVGDTTWRQGLPLVRIGGENVYRRREHLDYTVPDGFAGSILNLQPGVEYECRFEMTDPDGVTGESIQTTKVRTRTEPQPHDGGRVLHVYPPDYFGHGRNRVLRGSCRRTMAPGSAIGPSCGSGGRSRATRCWCMRDFIDQNSGTMSIR